MDFNTLQGMDKTGERIVVEPEVAMQTMGRRTQNVDYGIKRVPNDKSSQLPHSRSRYIRTP